MSSLADTDQSSKFFEHFIKIQKYLFISLPFLIFSGPFLADLSITLIGLIYFFQIIKEKKYNNLKSIFVYIFLIFWINTLISSFISFSSYHNIGSSIVYIRFLFFVLGGIYLLRNDKNTLRHFCTVLTCTFILVLFDGYIQYFFNQGISGIVYNKARLSNFITGELILGSYLSRLFPLVILLNIYFYKNNMFFIFLLSILIILVDVLIFLSGERASFFYLLISIILIILMINKFKILRLITFLLSFSIILIITINNDKVKNRMITQTFNDFKKEEKITEDNQLIDKKLSDNNQLVFFNKYNAFTKAHNQLYSSALKIYSDNNFLIGIGPKSFRKYCNKIEYISLFGEDSCSTHPHNTYIQLLTETGIIGFLIVFIIFLFITYKIVEHIFFSIFKKKYLLDELQIGGYIAIFISLWPIVPTGNFFNNWISITYFLPIIFILKDKYTNVKY
tara:strand:+ start:731 stop:2077 length:1347 start_codon:yes stop_codon:yes gene_type:complete